MHDSSLCLIEGSGVGTDKAAPVGIFAGDIDFAPRQVGFYPVPHGFERLQMLRQAAVDQHKQLDSCTGCADVPGLHVG